MFEEIAEAVVYGLGAVGVPAEAMCCQLLSPECWSPTKGAMLPFNASDVQARPGAPGVCRPSLLLRTRTLHAINPL
jgi:hypothetical protein